MLASARLKELAARKQLLLAQANLHRELLGFERLQFAHQTTVATTFLGRHRYWLLGGALVGGFLLARKRGGLVAWLPGALALLRSIRG